MHGSRMPLVQELRQCVAILRAVFDGNFEKGFLDIAGHIAPHSQSSAPQHQRKMVFVIPHC
ncbi:hypothetical protein XH98_04400 [Bradyrhizobium sp. CCBAU 51745]|nr:hypothetical protein [Bradyrhizobium sp. CCBAU 45384]MDA9438379.1 hypothetical protein [Bradyrhizobium sp. CCBAU 51745]